MLEAEHPIYLLRLEDGTTIDTSVTPMYLIPTYPPGNFAPDSDDPSREVQLGLTFNSGLFGLVIDTQCDLLRRIREAEEFAKALKSDDAQVLVYLWNECIGGWLSKEESEEARERAFCGFRAMGWRCFMRGLHFDCYAR